MFTRAKQNSLLRRLKLQAMNRLAFCDMTEEERLKLAETLIAHAVKEFEADERILSEAEIEKLKDRMIELTDPHVEMDRIL